VVGTWDSRDQTCYSNSTPPRRGHGPAVKVRPGDIVAHHDYVLCQGRQLP
jgi:hypothetical protein